MICMSAVEKVSVHEMHELLQQLKELHAPDRCEELAIFFGMACSDLHTSVQAKRPISRKSQIIGMRNKRVLVCNKRVS